MKKYLIPIINRIELSSLDIITTSDSGPENYNSYVDPNPGNWDDPIIDPDEPIDW